jgi:putative ABC transport system permease protein
MGIFISILEQGTLFAIMCLGIYITYKIMDFADMTVDGTFPMGAAGVALLLSRGVNPFLATFLAALIGSCGGMITGLIHTKLGVNKLMSGILVMTGLYSINLRIMGRANMPLFTYKTVFTLPEVNVAGVNLSTLLLITSILIVLKVLYDIFFRTKLGFFLRAVGDNEAILESLSSDSHKVKIIGLAIANFLAALSGALTAQYQGYADIGMGVGTTVMGLAAIIIALSIFKHVNLGMSNLAITGALIYKAILIIVLGWGIEPNEFKLVSAAAVVVALGFSGGALKKTKKSKKAEGRVLNASDKRTVQEL